MDEVPSLKGNIGYEKDVYQIARERVVHEDNLVNNRLTWFLVIQSLLFAAYGVVLELPGQAFSFKWLFAYVGVLSSLLTLFSVLGSRLARKSIRTYWDNKKIPGFPELHGTGLSQVLGDLEAYILPLVFIFSWGVVY